MTTLPGHGYQARFVDQILIRWSEQTLTGRSGVGPDVSSLTAQPDLTRWEGRLLAAHWAAAEVSGAVGEHGLVYLRFGDQAAVVRKEIVTDPRGRGGAPLAHALVGDAALLCAAAALGLHDWPGWITGAAPPPDDLTVLPAAELAAAAETGHQALQASARRLDPRVLARLAGVVLSDPAVRFTFIHPEAGTGSASAVELLCGLVDILGSALGKEWTFATAEPEEPPTADRPDMVFLTKIPGFSSRAASGRRVRVDRQDRPGEPAASAVPAALAEFGGALADAYAWRGPGVIWRTQPAAPVSSVDGALRWAGAAQFAPGVLNDPETVLIAVTRGQVGADLDAALKEHPGYLKAGLAALPGGIFGELLLAWGPEGTAARYPAVAAAIHEEAARRYLQADQATLAAGLLAEDVLAGLGIETRTWLEQLDQYLAEWGAKGTTPGTTADDGITRLAAVVGQVAAMLPTHDQHLLAPMLSGLTAAEMLSVTAVCGPRYPALGVALIDSVSSRRLGVAQRGAAAKRLADLGFLTEAIGTCCPDAPAGARLLTRLIYAVTGDEVLGRSDAADWLLRQAESHGRSVIVLWALGDLLPPRFRPRVVAAAAAALFANAGLPQLPVMEQPRQQPVAAATQRLADTDPGGVRLPGGSQAGPVVQSSRFTYPTERDVPPPEVRTPRLPAQELPVPRPLAPELRTTRALAPQVPTPAPPDPAVPDPNTDAAGSPGEGAAESGPAQPEPKKARHRRSNLRERIKRRHSSPGGSA